MYELLTIRVWNIMKKKIVSFNLICQAWIILLIHSKIVRKINRACHFKLKHRNVYLGLSTQNYSIKILLRIIVNHAYDHCCYLNTYMDSKKLVKHDDLRLKYKLHDLKNPSFLPTLLIKDVKKHIYFTIDLVV